MTVVRSLSLPLSLAVLAGCSAGTAGESPNLTATLVSPTDIALSWHPTEPDAAGQVVEYANEEHGDYTILRFAAPDETSYQHPDLIPRTPFFYRVRPYFGTASAAVDVSLPPGDLDESRTDPEDWLKPKTIPGRTAPTVPVRRADAAPTGFRATVMHANGIRFDWTDRAGDEDGVLLEVRPAGSADFSVAAVLDPDVNSAGLITLPAEKRATYRVRAYRYGEPTNIAHQTTGGQPD